MAGRDEEFEEDPEGTAVRLRALVKHYAEGNVTRFADEIGVEYKALNAAVNSGKLSKAVAFRIIKKYRAISLDWLWRGQDDTQAPGLTRQLQAAVASVMAEQRAAKRRAS